MGIVLCMLLWVLQIPMWLKITGTVILSVRLMIKFLSVVTKFMGD